MGGDDNAVEFNLRAILEANLGTPLPLRNSHYLGGQPHGIERGENFVAVGLRAAADGEPRMVRSDTEESMVLKKPDQAERWKIQHPLRLGGPHGRTHRHKVELKEVTPEAVPLHEFRHRALER